jgi:NAD(P)H-nitrite reductase large subunit
MLVAEPFGAAEALRLDLQDVVAEAGGRHLKDALASVDPASRAITTGTGNTLSYDALILAVGARPIESVPGALTFGDAAQRQQFEKLLRALGRRGTRRLVFIVPESVSWPIAAYELALLTAAERDVRNLPDVELMIRHA